MHVFTCYLSLQASDKRPVVLSQAARRAIATGQRSRNFNPSRVGVITAIAIVVILSRPW